MLSFLPAGEADIPLLRDLAQRIWRVCYPPLIGAAQVEHMLGRMYAAEALRRDLSSGVVYEIAVFDAEPAGYLAWSFAAPEAWLELHKLYLLPALHGRGLGQAMLAHVFETARVRGAREIRLRVNKGNARALRAYERAGFTRAGALCDDIGGGFVMDDLVLSREIGPASG